ncbi:sigma-70 family RNA polymerase sigma factor [Kitasatospora sp. NPDC127111]|uniref:BACON domain-containing protein n=1 Tax=Kitasatospora sp. NPDC127111 TaxID=3345363 RepID=UPI003625D662
MTTRTEGPRDLVLAAYERQVDGLFTYCLSVLCEHDAALAALREVRELALRHGARLAEPGMVRAWLYSLARYCCLRRLEDGAGRGTPPADTPSADLPTTDTPSADLPTADLPGVGALPVGAGAALPAAEAARRRRELASLAWPEAAGTDAEQREALELSVRHRLSPIEVAAVLGVPFETARTLLASAATEVGRTREALLVLGVGSCPELDRLGGAGAESWRDWVLGPALRRELVRHVVDCPTCRGTAERVADEVADGAAGLSGLPVLPAPGVEPVGVAEAAGGAGRGGGVPFLPRAVGAPAGRRTAVPAPVVEPGLRFDRSGFPRHRAPDAGRALAVRRRVVTTGVLAAVLAAPVVALWAGHRGGGGPGTAAAVSSVRVGEDRAGARPGDPGVTDGRPGQVGQVGGAVGAVGAAPVVAGLELAGAGAMPAETLLPGIQGPAIPVPAHGATPLGSPTLVAAPAPVTGPGPWNGGAGGGGAGSGGVPASGGLLTVEAGDYGTRTVLTLTNSGVTEIRWHAEVDAGWLRLSRDAGTLAPGQRITVIVTVDENLAPAAHWTARIALRPSQAVVTLEGGPHHRGGSTSAPAEPTESATAGPTSGPTAGPTSGPTAGPTAGPTGSGSPSPGGTPSTAPPGPGPTGGPSSPPSSPPASPGGTAPPTAGPSSAAPTATASAPPSSPPSQGGGAAAGPRSAGSRSASPR